MWCVRFYTRIEYSFDSPTVPASDPVLTAALQKYHRQPDLTDKDKSELLLQEYGITMRHVLLP
jgi:hypothetical protein